ncbi:hypothetical protein [Marinigracilibium pacificum]|uniref:Uncharacterized protein n=1 Tax=Marinigracilibium pacificum TaxID=2729599 RepID=A0A848J0A2_9BACT|nr:hypothetical protein [Marinigracilibium pacificum]NMM47904.1 hypothetical protein [Marinigracilibium pacificum]
MGIKSNKIFAFLSVVLFISVNSLMLSNEVDSGNVDNDQLSQSISNIFSQKNIQTYPIVYSSQSSSKNLPSQEIIPDYLEVEEDDDRSETHKKKLNTKIYLDVLHNIQSCLEYFFSVYNTSFSISEKPLFYSNLKSFILFEVFRI